MSKDSNLDKEIREYHEAEERIQREIYKVAAIIVVGFFVIMGMMIGSI